MESQPLQTHNAMFLLQKVPYLGTITENDRQPYGHGLLCKAFREVIVYDCAHLYTSRG